MTASHGDTPLGPRPPGTSILSQIGLCCGYYNSLVMSERIDFHWGAINRSGISILVASNAFGYIGLALLVRSLRQVRRGGGRKTNRQPRALLRGCRSSSPVASFLRITRS
jgi:hypothetical protein